MMPTPEQMLAYRNAVERVRNLEPFAADEVERLRAIPGLTLAEGARVRGGTILASIALDFDPRSYPDDVTNPHSPPTVSGTDVTSELP